MGLGEFLLDEHISRGNLLQALQSADGFIKTPQTAKGLCRPQVTQI